VTIEAYLAETIESIELLKLDLSNYKRL